MYLPSEIITEIFHHDTAGLSAGDFTIRLYKNGGLSAVVVTLTELGSGDYKVSFTPDASPYASWDLLVFETENPQLQYVRTYRTSPDLQELSQIIINFITGATRMATGVSQRVGSYWRTPEIIPKHEDAEMFVDFNFDYFLATGEEIEEAEVEIYHKGTGEDVTDIIGAETAPEIAGAIVNVWLEAGTPGSEYIVKVTATTDAAEVHVQLARLQVGNAPKRRLE